MDLSNIQLVPTSSIVSCIIVISLITIVPIAAIVWLKIKTHARLMPAIIGALGFIVTVMIIESFAHSVILNAFGKMIYSNAFLYAAYGGLMAAVFEEFGRYFIMKWQHKKFDTLNDGIMYGLGHGGIEAILLVGLSLLNTVLIMLAINDGSIATLFGTQVIDETMIAQLNSIASTSGVIYFVSLLERLLSLVLHVGLSCFVMLSVISKQKNYLFIAIGIHFGVDFVAGLVNTGLFGSVVGIVILYIGILVVDIWVMKKAIKDSEKYYCEFHKD